MTRRKNIIETFNNSPEITVITEQAFVVATTTGLVKQVNEDRIAFKITPSSIRMTIADGHWGDEAAQACVAYWSVINMLPVSRDAAITLTQHLEATIAQAAGTNERYAEASFVTLQIVDQSLRIIAYGDARLIVVRMGIIIYQLPLIPTWIGLSSFQGKRNRQSIESALSFVDTPLEKEDTILVFTDGVDECVYEVPTIAIEALAARTVDYKGDVVAQQTSIFNEVFANGAEDNATLAIITVI